jgi:hypothetical protein
MYAQVIVGKAKDAGTFKESNERWQTELKPGAKGFLGSTWGIADDSTTVMVVRFESEAAAKANSDRPEQGAFFAEASENFEAPPTFYNCPEVEVFGKGGSDDAGFVQVMIYKPKDVAALRAASAVFEKFASDRPDLLGGTSAFASDGSVIDTSYFTSEAEAREGEKKEMPAEMQDAMQSIGENMGDIRYIDLRDPRFS